MPISGTEPSSAILSQSSFKRTHPIVFTSNVLVKYTSIVEITCIALFRPFKRDV